MSDSSSQTSQSSSFLAVDTPPSEGQPDPQRLNVIYFSNEFPNDDLQRLLRQLYRHSKDKRHPVLTRFIFEATLTLRDEIRQLPVELKSLIPPFETILNLVEAPELRKGPLCGSVDGVLLCLVEIAAFIGYCENTPGGIDLDPNNSVLAGLGIGLLASAAVALIPTIDDLPLVAAEVIRIAFRLGVVVGEVSDNLENHPIGDESLESWAYVVRDATPEASQKELDGFYAKERTPEASKVFISALSRNSVTVSGPPSRLKRLFRMSGFFRDRKFFALPVYGGLCHAKHIYGPENAIDIVRPSSVLLQRMEFSPKISVLSTKTGKPFQAADGLELFERIITEILTCQIEWDNVIQSVVDRTLEVAASECQLFIFRMSLPVRDLQGTLKTKIKPLRTSTKDLIPWIAEFPEDGEAPRGPQQSKIAIIGMSCRMPGGATSTEKFWNLLESGMDVHRKVPADRFDVETHHDPAGKQLNTSLTPYGCFIDEPGLFDAAFFNMSPREASQTDPMQRLALVTAYEALERAGYVANRTAATNLHRVGTFYGQASDDYREVNTAQEIGTYFIPGGCRAFGPGRINYFFKFSGPSFSCDTACSSSLATIQAACTALWNGEVDTVVAGGMNVLTNSDAFAGLSNGHFLSKTPNACKTWDAEADGYCRADGIGSIVMKRLEDAEADNDNILGVILAAATNHSAEAVSITHPHAGAQSYLYRNVMSRAGVDPLDVSYVEFHGTGTQAGDSVEMESITNVFAPVTKPRTAKQPLYIGAVKANVGHGEAVAGVTALLKVLLMLQKGAIPPHVGIKNSINPQFPKLDLEKRNLHIPHEKQAWERNPDKARIAIVNNFSAAGGNTTVVIQEAPLREAVANDWEVRPSHVVAVSAKSKTSLKGNLKQFLAYLEANPDVSLSDLSYSTTARRYHHNHRVAVASPDVSHLRKQLNTFLEQADSHTPTASTGPPSVAFAFTGQGASHKSMNVELFSSCPSFRSTILKLDSIAQSQGFGSFIPAIDGRHPQDYVHSPVITQISQVCVQIALVRYWASLGVKPDVVVGHSLGEYAALHVAGVLSASDAIFLVGRRAQLLEQKCKAHSHKMMAVRASMDQIEKLVSGMPYETACINGPKDCVLSGTVEQMAAISEKLTPEGYRCIDLDVAFAFHSAQTDPVLDEFEQLANDGAMFKEPSLPVISPLLNKVVFDNKTFNAKYLRRATRETVNFVGGLESALKISTISDHTVWVEIGPHPVCMGFVKSTLPDTSVSLPSLRRGENSWTTMAQSLAAIHCTGVNVSWNEFHRPFERELRLLDLPTYSWNEKNYWIQYHGDWALTKGNNFYDDGTNGVAATPREPCGPRTSTVQNIIEESVEGQSGHAVMQSDLMQSDFLGAARGHSMNGCGVVTSSIHADIAFTLGKYLYNKIKPDDECPAMDVANLEVVKGLVAQSDTTKPQYIRVSATIEDIDTGLANLEWFNVNADGTTDEPFATATIVYGSASEWLESWTPLTHLVQSRIEALERMTEDGSANRFSRNMAYTLFAKNLVDYAEKYRGMRSVVLSDLEAFADVTLSTETGGTWTVPPHFIDSVAHLAGFIMNVSDAIDTKDEFCVTPGWQSMRFAQRLTPGSKYRSYVKMIPNADNSTYYSGDVYIFQDDVIIGMVGGIQFRRYPRILLDRFFSAPDKGATKKAGAKKPAAKAPAQPAASATPKPASKPKPAPSSAKPAPAAAEPAAEEPVAAEPDPAPAEAAPTSSEEKTTAPSAKDTANPDSTTSKAMDLIANEAGLELSDLVDDASFDSLGVDSLMSLVIAEKFRDQLGVTVSGSLFLEYPTIGALRAWLEEYYS